MNTEILPILMMAFGLVLLVVVLFLSLKPQSPRKIQDASNQAALDVSVRKIDDAKAAAKYKLLNATAMFGIKSENLAKLLQDVADVPKKPTEKEKATGSANTPNDEKDCPFCAETIRAAAIKCKHCGSDLTGVSTARIKSTQAAEAKTTSGQNTMLGAAIGIGSILLAAYCFTAPYFISVWLAPIACILGLIAIGLKAEVAGFVGLCIGGFAVYLVNAQGQQIQHNLNDAQQKLERIQSDYGH